MRTFQGFLLLGLSLFFAFKAMNGQLTWYINSRFIPLTIFGIIFLFILSQTAFGEFRRSRNHNEEYSVHHHDHTVSSSGMWLMLVPLAIGLLIPARPLDSSAFATKGFNTNAPLVSRESFSNSFEVKSQERNILDWLKLFNLQDDVSQFIGTEASVVGFVYFDESLAGGQFYVSRFVVSCCSADGFAVAMPVQWENTDELDSDSWVLVKGKIEEINLNGQRTPLIVADSVEPADIPAQPYLYP